MSCIHQYSYNSHTFWNCNKYGNTQTMSLRPICRTNISACLDSYGTPQLPIRGMVSRSEQSHGKFVDRTAGFLGFSDSGGLVTAGYLMIMKSSIYGLKIALKSLGLVPHAEEMDFSCSKHQIVAFMIEFLLGSTPSNQYLCLVSISQHMGGREGSLSLRISLGCNLPLTDKI